MLEGMCLRYSGYHAINLALVFWQRRSYDTTNNDIPYYSK